MRSKTTIASLFPDQSYDAGIVSIENDDRDREAEILEILGDAKEILWQLIVEQELIHFVGNVRRSV